MQERWHRGTVVLLLPESVAAGLLAHVPGEGGKDGEAADRVYDGHQRGHGSRDRCAGDPPGAKVHGGTVTGEPSAGLSGVRCGPRMRTAGYDVLIRRGRVEIH